MKLKNKDKCPLCHGLVKDHAYTTLTRLKPYKPKTHIMADPGKVVCKASKKMLKRMLGTRN